MPTILTGLALPLNTPSRHTNRRPFLIHPSAQLSKTAALPLVLEHRTTRHDIGTVDLDLTDTAGPRVTAAEIRDEDLPAVLEHTGGDLDRLAFSAELAPWEMALTNGVHVLHACTITAVAVTLDPAFDGTQVQVHRAE